MINLKPKVAPFTDPNSDMGPVISNDHKNKIINYINIGEKGAKLSNQMEEI